MNRVLDPQAIRQKLEEQRAPLLVRIGELEERLRSNKGGNPDHFDLAQDYVSRERRSIMLSQAREELKQVDAALRRLAEGKYGDCTQCGQPIDPARLEVRPHAAFCLSCQERQESNR